MGSIKVEEIIIYPIKGCRGVQVDKANLTSMGIEGDREFTLLLEGKIVNQSILPSLAKLGARYLEPTTMELTYPGAQTITFNTAGTSRLDTMVVIGQTIRILLMEERVSNWLSEALGRQVELAKMNDSMNWHIPFGEFDGINDIQQSKFVDASPLLLTNRASLEDLNRRMSDSVPMDRFRANIVVSGLNAYEEDVFAEFVFSDVSLRRVTVCERCIVTTTDQETAIRAKEPLLTLSKYRKRKEGYAGGIMFGMYLTVLESGVLCVGDSV
ncbi:MAG: hypothetical protein ACI9FB_000530 [Candidatus Azotimanducaceae bacterium]|jgi:uncharacterized protein YcbX